MTDKQIKDLVEKEVREQLVKKSEKLFIKHMEKVLGRTKVQLKEFFLKNIK